MARCPPVATSRSVDATLGVGGGGGVDPFPALIILPFATRTEVTVTLVFVSATKFSHLPSDRRAGSAKVEIVHRSNQRRQCLCATLHSLPQWHTPGHPLSVGLPANFGTSAQHLMTAGPSAGRPLLAFRLSPFSA